MDNNYKLLKDVVGFSYVIGSYQRGYRWDEVNVRELLEDIYENKLIEDYSLSKSDFMDENEAITELTKSIRDCIMKAMKQNYTKRDEFVSTA